MSKIKKNWLFLIRLSEESALHFMQWKEAEELACLAPPLIGCRKGFKKEKEWSSISFLKKGLIQTRNRDLSATEVRERLKNNLYCGHLVLAKALDYIRWHQLYFC